MKYALINENGSVNNIVIWDGVSEVQWSDGCTAVLATQEHETEFSQKNTRNQKEQLPLSDEEMGLLRRFINRIDTNGI
jgi:hypothetical protein